MKEKILYVCELCGKEYEKKEDATACEKNHDNQKSILDFQFHFASPDTDHTGLPDYLELNNKGKVYRYVRQLVSVPEKK